MLTSSDHKKDEEERFITSVLLENGYKARFIMDSKRDAVSPRTVKREWLSTAVIPYRRNTSEAIRRVLNQYKIRVTFQATNTLGRMLVHLKDPLESMQHSNCVYMLKCSDCDACYVGQTARQLGVRMKEHERCTHTLPKTPEEWKKIESDSAIALHAIVSGHTLDVQKTRILKQGFKSFKHRLTTETLLINTTANVVNRSEGAELSPIWLTLFNPFLTSRPSQVDPAISKPRQKKLHTCE
ncbi:GIY-YIG nuclease family protein, partial [Cetobacterium sp.]|uniref:GIY-YIG nuclease family protein n=1 Tax=Cetobacterium sp. TaxID=2071632 RepID=UPI003EE48406